MNLYFTKIKESPRNAVTTRKNMKKRRARCWSGAAFIVIHVHDCLISNELVEAVLYLALTTTQYYQYNKALKSVACS